MPAGRPTKYKKEYCQVLIDQMREGASIEEVAGEICVETKTLYNWAEKHPEFLQAKRKGEALSRQWWMKQGRIALRDKEFNSSLWYMNMKNRHGWRDKQDVTSNEQTITGVINVQKDE